MISLLMYCGEGGTDGRITDFAATMKALLKEKITLSKFLQKKKKVFYKIL